ncbi:ribonuclease PH [Loigolactobacillus binensis]|uniref:Multifunctional fusion protein n=1 Tax=Loigolactobacillus binensis TaxID=2559922 RepID=A0ABW3E9S7_9LACO|nr:ribonuclease PH [Loigolactobacillus binensis]
MQRNNNRDNAELRPFEFTANYLKNPEGSVLVTLGATKVICNVSVENSQPPFLRGTDKGWISAEYSMLPRATKERTRREATKGRQTGRTIEIQRLIGRALRAVVDLDKLGPRSLVADCDVIQADGGTRTASITGAFFALKLALTNLVTAQVLPENPLKDDLAAISVGILPEIGPVLDLDAAEDQHAAVDMNIVMTGQGEFIELQGTGEEATFSGSQLNELLYLGTKGIEQLITAQRYQFDKLQHPYDTSDISNTVVIATRNAGKAREFQAMFAADRLRVKTLKDFPDLPEIEETGKTFEENARLKADKIAQILNLPVLADDSGLQVAALHGRPGIYSARYAGDHNDAANNAKLLFELSGVPQEKRNATFHTTLVFAKPNQPTKDLVVEGEVKGVILGIPRGDNGFGYDPLFLVPALNKSLAELTEAEKNQVSHRGNALRHLEKVWRDWLNQK